MLVRIGCACTMTSLLALVLTVAMATPSRASWSDEERLKSIALDHLRLARVPTFVRGELDEVTVPDDVRVRYDELKLRHDAIERRLRRTRSADSSTMDRFFGLINRHKTGIPGDVIYADSFRDQLQFDMAGRVAPGSAVVGAELKLYKKLPNIADPLPVARHPHHTSGNRHSSSPQPTGASPVRHARVSIYLNLGEGHDRILIDSRRIAVNGSGWQHFDVTAALRRWQRNPSRFMTVTLELRVASSRPGRTAAAVARLVRFTGQSDSVRTRPKTPELVVFTERRRDASEPNDCRSSSRDQRCCRQRHVIDFDAMAWSRDWIVQPRTFEAFRCAGSCAHRQQRVRDTSRRACAATQTTSLPVLFARRGADGRAAVEVTELPDMVVERCGCQFTQPI